MSLHAWSSARYTIPLPAGHRFPIGKYAALRQRVLARGLAARVHDPARITRQALLRAHDAAYVDAFTAGALEAHALRRLGLPWSPALVERAWRAVSGTCEAAEAALASGIAINLAGGTHHAFRGRGEGFCVFNDVAVALLHLLDTGRIARAAVIDLDVHQGNGTHAIMAGDARVVTFSMHGRRNYPFHKVPGTIDVELEDGTADEEYLQRLQATLPGVIARARPDLVVYLAGVDPHEDDRLGRLCLTFAGLARRDAMVLQACREVGIPVAVTIAGGYGRDPESTIAAHLRTVQIAHDFA